VLDADSPTRRVVAETIVAAPEAGRYRYTVEVPGTRAISIIAGSDLGNSGGVCNPGEACGAYPTLGGRLEVLQPTGNLGGIDFTLAPAGGISPYATGMRR
jgi:serine protease